MNGGSFRHILGVVKSIRMLDGRHKKQNFKDMAAWMLWRICCTPRSEVELLRGWPSLLAVPPTACSNYTKTSVATSMDRPACISFLIVWECSAAQCCVLGASRCGGTCPSSRFRYHLSVAHWRCNWNSLFPSTFHGFGGPGAVIFLSFLSCLSQSTSLCPNLQFSIKE